MLVAIACCATGLGLVACGNDEESGPGMHHSTTAPADTAPADHNAADVTFATAMIPHHQQAVQMADQALKKATNAQVKQLATAIKAAQAPEIEEMSAWLKGWDQMVPTPGMGHSMASGEGMMTTEEMMALGNQTGAAFDKMWVRMMITHHQGAVAMAKMEQTSGQNPKSKQLAQQIERGQTTEITTMQKLLTTLP
ncbi:DUF305 domain-containing protein [Kribbella sp. NPDC000426]|uniref:DUF305 domain-containing protein n=1 Tax=Kribbella sp. NPDC000426 TaxID=3154255 RepID=UPI0033269DBD